MKETLVSWMKGLWYSLPIQLLLNHAKRNHILLLGWLLLFMMVTGNFGNYLGIPYLFLDPVYLNKVSFLSFFLVGLVIAGFSIAFHISTYISDGHRFTFIGTVSKPFTTFSVNNSIIPFAFLIIYVITIIKYQISNENVDNETLLKYLSGFMLGYVVMTVVLFIYFWFTNKDIFKYVVCKVDEKLKQNIKATRASAMKKLNIARKNQIHVKTYVSLNFEPKKVDESSTNFYDRTTILQVFDQNHLNLVIIELLIFALLFAIGVFKDNPVFQLPAAASAVLFLTVFVMISGAFNYWVGSWATSLAIALFLVFNFMVKEGVFQTEYRAFGLNYNIKPTSYNLNVIDSLNSPGLHQKDKQVTLKALNNWRAKFPADQKPKMVFLCVSGGGQRAALWTLNVLQHADSITNGELMQSTMLITGASGGLIGAAYYRELLLQARSNPEMNLFNRKHLADISSDNLNAIIFNMLMNDSFVGFTDFKYNNQDYEKDRGYAFEQQLNKNTNGYLDKPLAAYREPELNSEIPMMIMAPTIINDGRKIYISPQNVSYMSNNPDSTSIAFKSNGVDFLRLFSQHGAEELRFLSGLRMSATFPYITPNITLPSEPPLEIMDAGITDNFGISDAIHFLYAFRSWISENTEEVIIISIRDSKKDADIAANQGHSLIERFSLPISSIYDNFESLQDINNDGKIAYAGSWFNGKIRQIEIQYEPQAAVFANLTDSDSLRFQNTKRASLSWRLTSREKQSLINNILTKENQHALQEIKEALILAQPN